MSGADDVTVVWVDNAASHDEAARALGEWGRARGLRVVTPSERGASRAMRVDLAIAEGVERELDRARDAIAALDADAAERALARADASLREHPELPHAAWLRAEVHRSWAARWTRIEPRDDVRARLAWQEGDALDGGRVAGVGEIAFPARPSVAVTVVVQGSSGALLAHLDGLPLEGKPGPDGTLTYSIEAPPAEHQLVISSANEPIFASWVSIAEAAPGAPRPTVNVAVGDEGACAASSLAGVTREGETVRAPGVSCAQWVAAAAGDRRGAVVVARCQGSTCGPFLEWRAEPGFGGGPADRATSSHGAAWPRWATWTTVGVGAVAAATITLIASGVFASRPTEPRFVAGGVRTE